MIKFTFKNILALLIISTFVFMFFYTLTTSLIQGKPDTIIVAFILAVGILGWAINQLIMENS